MKTITHLIFLTVLCFCTAAFAKQCRQGKQSAELFRTAEARIRRLDRLERLLLNEYFRGKQRHCLRYSFFYKAPQVFVWNDRVPCLRDGMIDPYFVPDRAALLLDTEFLVEMRRIKEDRAQTHLLRASAASVLRLADELGVYPDNIYRKHEPKPAQTPTGPVSQAQPLQKPVTSEPGTVIAVIVDSRRPLCMIEGIDQVLGEGDRIDQGFGERIKVVKLETGQAELQKGRRTWIQKVGESPSGKWG